MTAPPPQPHTVRSDVPFYIGLCLIGGLYIFLIIAMLMANTVVLLDHDVEGQTSNSFITALQSDEIQYSIKLSLITCSITAILSLWVAIPIGYLMSRHRFPGKAIIDAILDIPIVLPPLVIGLSLLVLFTTPIGVFFEDSFKGITGSAITYAIPGVILAQFMVACAFAVRTMRATFEELHPRREQVAMSLGCSRAQAFLYVTLPEARRGVLVAGTLAWARSLGEFGPILIFGGATRMKTEVLPTSVFLELAVGNIEAAIAVSMLMVLVAMAVLILVRFLGQEEHIR